ncbi:unnamed protein product, partial [Iphiclides podalirius]
MRWMLNAESFGWGTPEYNGATIAGHVPEQLVLWSLHYLYYTVFIRIGLTFYVKSLLHTTKHSHTHIRSGGRSWGDNVSSHPALNSRPPLSTPPHSLPNPPATVKAGAYLANEYLI